LFIPPTHFNKLKFILYYFDIFYYTR
jgi:hypothetical protein